MRRIIVALTGASGAVYGIRALELLREVPDVETHLVLTKATTGMIATSVSVRYLEMVQYLNGTNMTTAVRTPSTAPRCSAGSTSISGIGVGAAPSVRMASTSISLASTRIFSPLKSPMRRIGSPRVSTARVLET